MEQQEPRKKPSFPSLIGSLLAAAFGVQSSRNRERDFGQGSATHFIVGGIIFATVFVLVVVLVVNLVLP